MPKIKYQPPKYSKIKVGKKQYAAVYVDGKTIYLGAYGSPESRIAYSRFVAEYNASKPSFLPRGEPVEESNITVKELALAFLDYVKELCSAKEHRNTEYHHSRTVIKELLKLYGDGTLAGDFAPSCLKLVRQELIKSHRFCRGMVNKYTRHIIKIFDWGVENEYVHPNVHAILKAVKSLPEGYPGTFDNPEREDVPDDVIKRTLPFMPPTVAAMVKLQRLTGMRPSEVFNMRVGEIDRTSDPDLWYYKPPTHKTKKKTKIKKIVPLSQIEQKLIAPYLEGKTANQAVFSPAAAMAERYAERRANRKTKITPSQQARNDERASKPRQYSEFYNRDSYRHAVNFAIAKGNKVLPEDQQIPHWTPYQLRHAAATAMEIKSKGLDKAQALLGHKTVNMTRRYAHGQLVIAEEMARDREDPFKGTDE